MFTIPNLPQGENLLKHLKTETTTTKQTTEQTLSL